MAALGLTNSEIARRLHVTVHAVKFHLAGVYRKLGVANRTEAAVLYLRSAMPTGSRQSRSRFEARWFTSVTAPATSRRTPRFSVRFRVTRQSSCAKKKWFHARLPRTELPKRC